MAPTIKISSASMASRILKLNPLQATTRLKISYVSLGSNTKTVVLTFVKQENGQFLLIRKFALGLDRTAQTDDGVKSKITKSEQT